MTTIAWDGTTLAADSLGTCGGRGYHVSKLRRTVDGRLIAGAGEFGAVVAYLDWLSIDRRGDVPPRPAFQDDKDMCVHALEILTDGKIMRHERFAAFQVLDDVVAIGSGAAYAIGAMAAGKCSAAAVEIACRFDTDSGGPVHVAELI